MTTGVFKTHSNIFNPTWKVSKYGVIAGSYFRVLGLNTGKYGPEIIPYLGHFSGSFGLLVAN